MSNTEDTVRVEVSEPPLVQLFMDIDPEGHAAAYLPVRWCLSPALVTELENQYFRRPYLLVTVRAIRETTGVFDDSITEYTDTAHYAVPLDRELTYIGFSRPGRNQVLATVVDIANEGTRDAVSRWIRGKNSGNSLYESDGSLTYHLREVSSIATRFVQEVEVDREMFAKEPPRWANWLVGKFHEGRPFDECHFRRRLLLSMLLYAPLMLTLGVVVRVVAMLVVLSLGLRRIDWHWLQPFNMDATPRKNKGYGSIWVHNKYGRARPWPFWFLNPVTLIGGPVLTWLFVTYMLLEHHGKSVERYRIVTWDFPHTVLYVDGTLIALVVFASLVAGIVIGVATLGGILIDAVTRRPKKVVSKVDNEEAARAAMLARLGAMTCTNGALNVSVDALPKGKRTLALRFSELKGVVCKPFAR